MEQPYLENSHFIFEEDFLKIGEEGQNKGIDPIQEINGFDQGNNDSFIHENNYFIGDFNDSNNISSIDYGNLTAPTNDNVNMSAMEESEFQKIKKSLLSLKLSNSSLLTTTTTAINTSNGNENKLLNKTFIHNPYTFTNKCLFNVVNLSNIDRLNTSSQNSKNKKGRKKVLFDGIKTEVLDRSLIREFKKYLKNKDIQNKEIFEEDPLFWNEFFQNSAPPFIFTNSSGEKIEYKSFNKNFLRFIFDKQSVVTLYSRFIKERENDFITKILNKSRKNKNFDKKLIEFYKMYGKNLHKLYSNEYSISDCFNDENIEEK